MIFSMSVHGKKYTHLAEYTIYIGYAPTLSDKKQHIWKLLFSECYSIFISP